MNSHYPVGFSHGLRGEVAVGSGSVPVARHRFRVEGDHDAEFLGDAVQQETGHPQVVADANAFARSDLEFPLKYKKRVREVVAGPSEMLGKTKNN